VVPYARAAFGVNVATTPVYVTAPATFPPGPANVNVEDVIEPGLIAMLNVAVTFVVIGTLVAP
jgi:hypothetical protein